MKWNNTNTAFTFAHNPLVDYNCQIGHRTLFSRCWKQRGTTGLRLHWTRWTEAELMVRAWLRAKVSHGLVHVAWCPSS